MVCLGMATGMGWQVVSGQVIKQHELSVGIAGRMLTDRYILSSPASGELMALQYSFDSYSAAWKKSFSVAWGNGLLTNAASAARINSVTLRYSQAWPVVKSRKFNGYLGYSLSSNPVLIRAGSGQSAQYSWATTSNISLYHSGVYTARKGQWMLDVYVPLAGLCSRPGEKAGGSHTTEGALYDSYSRLFATSWHNQQQVSVSLGYTRSVSDRMKLVLQGRFDYQVLKSDYRYQSKEAGLSAGIAWQMR